MTALPDRDILDGTDNPTTSAMKTAMGQLYDALSERIGGATGVGAFTTLTLSAAGAALTFSAAAARITGDFSNATLASRVLVQSSTTNGETSVGAVPNGTSTTASFVAWNGATPTNADFISISALSTSTRLESGRSGSGTYRPLQFYVSGAEWAAISIAGTFTLGGTSSAPALSVVPVASQNRWLVATASNGASPSLGTNAGNLVLAPAGGKTLLGTTTDRTGILGIDHNGAGAYGVALQNTDTGSSSQYAIRFTRGAGVTEVGSITTTSTGMGINQYAGTLTNAGTTVNGNCLVVSASGGLGYGTGAGGTVTQATSKATGVTLSKPTGEITLHNAALAAATIVSFVLTNTTIAAGDHVLVQHVSGGTVGAYSCTATAAAGSATIYVRNDTAGSLGEAIVLKVSVLKSVTA